MEITDHTRDFKDWAARVVESVNVDFAFNGVADNKELIIGERTSSSFITIDLEYGIGEDILVLIINLANFRIFISCGKESWDILNT